MRESGLHGTMLLGSGWTCLSHGTAKKAMGPSLEVPSHLVTGNTLRRQPQVRAICLGENHHLLGMVGPQIRC